MGPNNNVQCLTILFIDVFRHLMAMSVMVLIVQFWLFFLNRSLNSSGVVEFHRSAQISIMVITGCQAPTILLSSLIPMALFLIRIVYDN